MMCDTCNITAFRYPVIVTNNNYSYEPHSCFFFPNSVTLFVSLKFANYQTHSYYVLCLWRNIPFPTFKI